MSSLNIAFWNLQNLYAPVPSNGAVREMAREAGYMESNGWNDSSFQQKLDNLTEIINLMHEGEKPDLLGICEVENKEVVEALVQKLGRDDYEIAHQESNDIRAIDVSLIYSSKKFELIGEPTGHLVHLRYPTRDIFEVPLRIRENGADITVLVNHWPSRNIGQYESEPFRITLASHCGTLIDKVLKFSSSQYIHLPDNLDTLRLINNKWNKNVLVMGDFNDEPFNRSLMDTLQASNGTDNLEEDFKNLAGEDKIIPPLESYRQKQAFLFNCMWSQLGKPDLGTFFYSKAINTLLTLDHFIISKGLYYGVNGLKMNLDSVEIFQPGIMTSGKGRPIAYSVERGKGYSDHFPIISRMEIL
ncbi:MAG: hypothetical protein AAGC85_20520 [Bacteroidota bacterium]